MPDIATDTKPAVNQPAQAATTAGPAHTVAILTIILVSYFMILLDNSVIFAGLPTIGRAMHLSPVGLSWVQDAYTLVFGGLLLLGARLGDVLGRRRVFVVGLVLFAPCLPARRVGAERGVPRRGTCAAGRRCSDRGVLVPLPADGELPGGAGAHPGGGPV